MEWTINDQVLVKSPSDRSRIAFRHKLTREVRVGQITAFADNETAVVSLSMAGGRTEKKEIPIDQLEPVPHASRRQVHIGF